MKRDSAYYEHYWSLRFTQWYFYKNQRFVKCPNIWDCARGESSSVELWETWSKLWQPLKPFSLPKFCEEEKNNFESKNEKKSKNKLLQKYWFFLKLSCKKFGETLTATETPCPSSSPSKMAETKKNAEFINWLMVIVKDVDKKNTL